MQDIGQTTREEVGADHGRQGADLFRVTLPKVRLGLLYGVVIAKTGAARWASSAPVGRVRGATSAGPDHTVPLRRSRSFYNELQKHWFAAFAVFAVDPELLGRLATLGAKKWSEGGKQRPGADPRVKA